MRTKAPKDPELAARRLRALLEELEREHGNRARLSDRTGLSRSYINKLLQGERTSVGQGAIDTVANFMRLSPKYFEPEAEGKSYRDFVDEFATQLDPHVSTSVPNANVAWLFGPALDFGLTALRNYGPDGWFPPGTAGYELGRTKGEWPTFALTVARQLRNMPMLALVDAMEEAFQRGDTDLVMRIGAILGELASILSAALADEKVAKYNERASELIVEAHDLISMPPEKRPREEDGPAGIIERFAREQRERGQKSR